MSDAPRRPLVPLNPELRRKLLAEMPVPQELDGNDSPIPVGLSDEEKKAALNPGLPAPPKEKSMTPLIPPKFAALAAAAATALGAAAAFAPSLTFLPPWVGFTLWALAVVAALLAGVALPSFKGTSPVVPATLVPLFLTAASALAGFASTLAPGTFQTVVMFLAIVCAALGGKALPQPTVPLKVIPPGQV